MKSLWAGLAVLVLGVGLIFLRESPRGKKQIQDWLIGLPHDTGPVFRFSASLDFSAEKPVLRTDDGESIELDWEKPMAAKTQVTTEYAISYTIAIWCPAGEDADPPVHELYLWADAGIVYLGREMHEGESCYKFEIGDVEGHVFSYIVWWPATGHYEYLDFEATLSPIYLHSSTSEHPIGAKAGVTHAKEMRGEDEWYREEASHYHWSLGEVSHDWDGEVAAALLSFGWNLDWHGTFAEPDYPDKLENIVFNHSASINADKLDEYITAYIFPSGVDLHVWGEGSSIFFGCDEDMASGAFTSAETCTAPLSYSFNRLTVTDMDGNLLDSLEIWCTGVRELDDEGNDIGPEKKTLAEWRAFSRTQSTGIATWESDDPDLLAPVGFYADEPSSKTHLLEGFQGDIDVNAVAWQDARICVHGWPLSKTSRASDPHVSDIALVQHMWYASVYGDALAHTDWVADADATAPDANGNFTVTAADGSLTLEIPNNYEDRLQVQVPAQTAPEGVPQAYITRQSGFYAAPWPSNPEPSEGVYCWLGWGYLYIDLTAPEATTVTALISYYDADGHSDNHLSDASRQTSYGYTTGDLTTHEYETAIGEGFQSICVDLATETPMRVVKSIKLTFGAVGDWKLGTPLLALDSGDAQAEPPRSGVTPHSYHKEFEHYAYKRGGISACVDGQYLEAIAWPDESHPNTLEPTGGHFDFVVGAESGIDLTSAWSLSQFVSLISRSSDAWSTTYDSAAAEAAFKDEDDVWLKTPHCFDLRPVNLQTGAAFDVAVRVGQWTTARGLHYDFNAEKIVEGQGHGWALTDAGGRVRDASLVSKLWRRELGSEDDWTEVSDLDSDGHGHWHSDSEKVVMAYEDGSRTLWEYGVGTNAGSVSFLGRFACREYQAGQLPPGGDVWTLFIPEARVLLYFYAIGDEIWLIYSNHERQWWEDPDAGHYPYVVPHKVCAGTSASAYRDLRHGFIVLGYVLELQAYVRTSEDMGETWSDAMAVDLGVEVERSMQWQDEDSQLAHIVAVTSVGELIHAKSSDNFVTLLDEYAVVTDGVPTRQPCGYTQRGVGGHGTLLVGFVGADNSQRQFKSENLGEDWEEVE